MTGQPAPRAANSAAPARSNSRAACARCPEARHWYARRAKCTRWYSGQVTSRLGASSVNASNPGLGTRQSGP